VTAAKASTRSLVRNAALQLMHQGERPSAKSIHSILGRGSLSTIQDELASWWKTLASDLSDASDSTPLAVLDLASSVWDMALQKATQSLRETHQHLQEDPSRLANMEKNLAALEASHIHLQRSLHASEAVNEELRTQTAYLQKMLSMAQEDVIQARAFHKSQIELAGNRYAEMENRLMVQMDGERQARKAAEETARRLRAGLSPARPDSSHN